MAETASDLTPMGAPDLMGAVALESNEELAAGLEEDFALMSAAQGRLSVLNLVGNRWRSPA